MKIRHTVLLVCVALTGSVSYAQEAAPQEKSFEIYGHVQMDAGYNAGQIDPNWYDVMRPTKLPSYKNEYGTNGNFFMSVRQTRFGVKSYTTTPLGELKTWFEFEMFGTGVDAGQTTLRLRHAYGELGKFGAGQTWSPFMDIDVFPNSLEYWGPNGMVFYRNVQFRYMPIQGDTRMTFALERPGATPDQSMYANRIELQGVKPHLPLPDLSGEYRLGRKWGYVELAGIVRYIGWKDLVDTNSYSLTGHAIGWGLNLSTNVKIGENNVFRGQVVYGQGIQNYMNDATYDIGIKTDPTAAKPVKGVALPMIGIVAFVDHNWNAKWCTSIGYSYHGLTNSNGQPANAFKDGHYALVNLLFKPVTNVMTGIEVQYGTRQNYQDGFSYSAAKVQASFKYNFAHVFYKTPPVQK